MTFSIDFSLVREKKLFLKLVLNFPIDREKSSVHKLARNDCNSSPFHSHTRHVTNPRFLPIPRRILNEPRDRISLKGRRSSSSCLSRLTTEPRGQKFFYTVYRYALSNPRIFFFLARTFLEFFEKRKSHGHTFYPLGGVKCKAGSARFRNFFFLRGKKRRG